MMHRWATAVLNIGASGGLAVVRSPEGFMLGQDGRVLFDREQIKALQGPAALEHGIGYLDDQPVFLVEYDAAMEVDGCQWQGLRPFMVQADFKYYQVLAYAAQISTWAREHRFCGSCGQPMTQVPGERAMACSGCRLHSYPRISPSMIVLITRGDEILLARSPRFVSGVYSTLAGFVEPGESAEDCVVREVREEVSLEVRDIRYMGSQCWPFPHSLMLGFHAEYAGGSIVPQADEIEDARWFSVHALPPLPAPRSIARYLIDLYVARRLGLPEPVLPR